MLDFISIKAVFAMKVRIVARVRQNKIEGIHDVHPIQSLLLGTALMRAGATSTKSGTCGRCLSPA
jgi:hypothetical protein